MWVIFSQKPIEILIEELDRLNNRAEIERYIRQSNYLYCIKLKNKKKVCEIKNAVDAYAQCFNVPLFVVAAHNQWIYENPALCKLTYWEYISTLVEMTPDNFCDLENIEKPRGELLDADRIYRKITETIEKHNFNRSPVIKLIFEKE